MKVLLTLVFRVHETNCIKTARTTVLEEDAPLFTTCTCNTPEEIKKQWPCQGQFLPSHCLLLATSITFGLCVETSTSFMEYRDQI